MDTDDGQRFELRQGTIDAHAHGDRSFRIPIVRVHNALFLAERLADKAVVLEIDTVLPPSVDAVVTEAAERQAALPRASIHSTP